MGCEYCKHCRVCEVTRDRYGVLMVPCDHIRIEPDDEPSSPIVTCGNCAKRKTCELYIHYGNDKDYCSHAVLEQ